MKRVYVTLGMIVVIVAVAFYSNYRVNEVYDELGVHLESVRDALAADDQQRLEGGVKELCNYWKEEEHKLVHLIRHTHVEDITKSVARLEALSKYRDDAQLMAELTTIQWQIEHLKESERPTWNNIW